MSVGVYRLAPTNCPNIDNNNAEDGITTYDSYYKFLLHNFDFSTIPSNLIITDFDIKIKAVSYNPLAFYIHCDDAWTNESVYATTTTESVIITLSKIYSSGSANYNDEDVSGETIPWSDILNFYNDSNYNNDFYIDIRNSTSSTLKLIYGVEIDLYYYTPDVITNPKNKIVLNDITLIDLTSDTVTASDVDSGVLFHLPDGTTTTGTNTSSSEASTKTATLSTAATSLSITGLTAEPEWFVLYYTSMTARANPIPLISYDGTDIDAKRMYASRTSANVRIYDITDSTMTYSNGTMTLTNTSYNFPAGNYMLVYA